MTYRGFAAVLALAATGILAVACGGEEARIRAGPAPRMAALARAVALLAAVA